MIDWQQVNELKQAIGATAFDTVVTLFLQEADKTTALLAAATTADQISATLHALKGSALNLGFTELAQICQSCEIRADTGETDLPLDQVQAAYVRSRAEFVLKLPEMTS
ncbi:MAG: Hpt domain-containing protein [Paracoccaceae bacterium]